jgi:hypothetical protein
VFLAFLSFFLSSFISSKRSCFACNSTEASMHISISGLHAFCLFALIFVRNELGAAQISVAHGRSSLLGLWGGCWLGLKLF